MQRVFTLFEVLIPLLISAPFLACMLVLSPSHHASFVSIVLAVILHLAIMTVLMLYRMFNYILTFISMGELVDEAAKAIQRVFNPNK